MRKKLSLALMLCILGISTGWGAHTITGDGSTPRASVSDLSGGEFTFINAGDAWVLTLNVENPNGALFNDYGSSIIATGNNAFPIADGYNGLQLYLGSSINGGVLKAIFDGSAHNVDNVSNVGNFQAIITYDGGKGLTIETTNSGGTKATETHTLTDSLPAIAWFSFGLPTGINVTADLTKELEPTQPSYSLNCPTIGTTENGKVHFTSDKLTYEGECNKLRFTLTDSKAYFSGGAKRMSFDSFILRNANGDEVALSAKQFSGNNGKNNFGNMLDGVNGTFCNAGWGSGTEDDYFEIFPIEDLGGAFSFEFVTENTEMDAKAFRIEFLDEVLLAKAPQGNSYDTPAVKESSTTPNAPSENNKYAYYFTSDKMYYPGECNKLRFTLTASDATYSNYVSKRMSFDSFILYDANGNKVQLSADQFTGNNGKIDGQHPFANMLDGVNGNCCYGEWPSGTADDYFEIRLSNDLGGSFYFAFVTENATMNAKAFNIEVLDEYVLEVVGAPAGADVVLQYNGEPISAGTVCFDEALDADLLTANEVPNHVWAVVVDKANAKITVKYTEALDKDNPASVVDLVERIGGTGTANKFKFVLSPSLNSKYEAFAIGGSEDGKILIKGTTLSAITTGLGWYLNYHAHINIAWNSLNEKVAGASYADLSDLPVPSTEETHTCDAKYRYYLNYCTFGYSMTTWTWKRWQQEIDWMALHGVNMPLQIIGLEEVWRKFLTIEENGKRKYNYTDTEAKAFVAGPAFTGWWGMNNLEGWGGTDNGGRSGVQDNAWYTRQAALAQSILERQRELGMQPVLPGFSGMVPSNFTEKNPDVATDDNGKDWGGFVRPYIIDPTAEQFDDIAADYYACLEDVMGESQYYSMDPFHEGGSISSGKYSEAYKAIYDAMDLAKQGSQWVIQQWQWSGNQSKSLNAVPAGRLLVLDLFSDGSPAFDKYAGYAPQEAIFCAIPNFGGRSGLMGRLNNLTDNYFTYKAKYASIKGVGAAPEAIEQTPVTYDLLFQLPWMGSKPDVKEWVKNYSKARYGVDNAVVQEAWELLRNSALNYGADGIQGPVEDVWAARPNLDASPASTWGVTINSAGSTYTRERRQMVADATYKLLAESENLSLASGSIYESNYLYDIVEFGGAVMADYAYDLLLGIRDAKNAAGSNFASDATYCARRDAFLALIADMDTLRGTNLNFRLGKWTQEARDAAAEVTGATTATADWYEFNNARTIITTWGDRDQNGGLKDYSYRSWQGLLKDYYLPRWQYFFDNNCNGTDYFFFEWNWAHGMVHEVGQTEKSNTPLTEGQTGYSYSREPVLNTIDVAKELFAKYIAPVTLSDGVFYAYNYLENDLSNSITFEVKAGESIDLTPYFDTQEGAKVTGDFINGEATDLSKVVTNPAATYGSHIGTVTLANGVTVKFTVTINPPFNAGTYNINYKAGNGSSGYVFIAYNDIVSDNNQAGNKLMGEADGVSTSAEADKIFTLTLPSQGFTISAQGQYLKAHTLNSWKHVLFSEAEAEAGVYVVEPVDVEGEYKLRHTGDGKQYVNAYDAHVFGSDDNKTSGYTSFTFTPVSTYPFTITSAGMATLCLPFNVVLPEGLVAFDFAASGINDVANGDNTYVCTMQAIAQADDVLKAGTPVIVKGAPGSYTLTITMENEGACTSIEGSLLRGNFLKQDLVQHQEGAKIFIFTKPAGKSVGFYIMDGSGTIGANKCWMEWSIPETMAGARGFVFDFSTETGIEDIVTTPQGNTTAIYNLAGQRLSAPQKGVNIIGNKKVIIR